MRERSKNKFSFIVNYGKDVVSLLAAIAMTVMSLSAIADISQEYTVEFDASGGEQTINLKTHTSVQNYTTTYSRTFSYASSSARWITGINVLGYKTDYTFADHWSLEWDSILYDNSVYCAGALSTTIYELYGNPIQVQVFCEKNTGSARSFRAQLCPGEFLTVKQKGAMAAVSVAVMFNSNGGSSCSSREYTVGGTYGSLPEPTKSGYTFAGWYSNSSLTTRVYASTTVSSSVTTLHAKWEASLQNVTVAFDSNGGSSCSSRQYTIGGTYGSLPSPTKSGYTFAGWYSNSSLSTRVYTSTTVSSSVTMLYAKWEENQPQTVTVSFNSNGGSSCSSREYMVGSAYGTLPAPTKSGYSLFGWYKDTAHTSPVYSWTIVDEMVTTLYASWLKDGEPTFFMTDTELDSISKLNGCVDLVIPSGIKRIKDGIFCWLDWEERCALQSVTIPASVEQISIPDDTPGCYLAPSFAGAYFKKFYVSSSNKRFQAIDNLLYNKIGCLIFAPPGLLNVSIPDGTTRIAPGAFTGSKAIEISIPSSVTNIGCYAFRESNVAKVHIQDVKSWCNLTFDCYESELHLAHPCNKSSGSLLCLNGEPITELEIPFGVTNINRYSFWNCISITNAKLSN